MIRSVVLGCGSYLPSRVLTNTELAQTVDTTDEWIVAAHRHSTSAALPRAGELTSDLSTARGARRARACQGGCAVDRSHHPCDVDARSDVSCGRDNSSRAGNHHGAAFDMQAVCSGFGVLRLSAADNFVKSGQCRRVLVIGAETFSRILDWEDRTTCVLFGDGAGAVMIEGRRRPAPANERGIIGSVLRSDGRFKNLLYVDGGPSSTKTVGHLRMQGKEVFRFAVSAISEVIEDTLESA